MRYNSYEEMLDDRGHDLYICEHCGAEYDFEPNDCPKCGGAEFEFISQEDIANGKYEPNGDK